MAIQDDFTIFPDSKVVRHTSGTTVYTLTQFHSYLMDAFDEPGFLSYAAPIKFNTPTSFTMINGWFLDDGDGLAAAADGNILQYLTGGGIDTLGYATVADPVYMLDMDNTVDFTDADQDAIIEDGGTPVGPLLAFKNDYPSAGLARIWLRDTRGTPATIANDSVITTLTAGPGAGDAFGASVNGDEIYHNLFTIAAFPTDVSPQVYIYQNHPQSGTRVRIAEWSAFTNWDRGSIDVLIPVKLGGTLIDSGNITTFVRQTGDTFTFVESTLSTAGRTPIATETSADEVNITVGEYYLLYDASDTGSFTADDVIADVDIALGIPPTWYAEVVAIEEFGDDTTGLLTLRGLRGSIVDNDPIFVGSTQESLANGLVGDTVLNWTADTDPTTVNQILTGGGSGALRLQSGVDITEDRLVCRVDNALVGSARDAYYIQYTLGETVTGATEGSIVLDAAGITIISGFSDVTAAHMNGTVTTSGGSGTWERGETITWNAGGSSAIFIDANSLTAPTTMMLGNVDATDEPDAADVFVGASSGAGANSDSGLTDDNTQGFEFALQSTGALYSVFIEGGAVYNAGRSLTDIYAYLQFYLRDGQSISDRIIYTSDGSTITEVAAEEYIKADSGYSSTKPAPYGTLAGGVFFGAQAVWVQGMQTSDDNNIKLLDSTGTLREPFTTIALTITNTRVDDRIALFLEDGTTELPDKDTFTSDAALNALGDQTFERDTGAFPNDTPTSGTFIVQDDSLNKQHRYRFDSRNGTTDPGIFTLPSEITGTTDGNTASQILHDSGNDWTGLVEIGDIVHRTSGTLGFAYVTSFINLTDGEVGTTLIEDTSGTAATAWSVADTFAFHSLVVLYTGSDTFFVPYIDVLEDTGTDATPGSVTQSLTFVSDREVVLFARNVENTLYEIVPFKTTGTVTNAGLSLSVIRNEDTVFTP